MSVTAPTSPITDRAAARISPLSPNRSLYEGDSSSFAYRRYSSSRLSDTRRSLGAEEENTSASNGGGPAGSSSASGTNHPVDSAAGARDPLARDGTHVAPRWQAGPGYGAVNWREGFGSSNERRIAEEEALDPNSVPGSPDIDELDDQDESASTSAAGAGPTGSTAGTDDRPKRRSRRNPVKKEMDEPPNKKRRSV
ncbi:hypothetical protein BD324DRAFT_193885 [Kockovaella imperatae]|uniref:Uncharacterized protein n=1 Tax=Kockovaella imperatae TaxID=4999 RepID=A0A1Y1U7N2_9TREE|nr:hypothetical protein BD324DRAFT_193885 [Kockovaella imperatae]ORX34041.1 hypothetical protein BD324DRAFT_193885 [Kockovaella imperatae]